MSSSGPRAAGRRVPLQASGLAFGRELRLSRSLRLSLFACGGWLALACTHYVGRGRDLYHEGRYIEAAHVLEMSERRLAEASPGEQAVYALYRGATLHRLGDLEGAEHWLAYAESRRRANPALLSSAQAEMLEETRITLQADLDRRAAARGF